MRTRRMCSAGKKSLMGRIQRRGMRFYRGVMAAVSVTTQPSHAGATKKLSVERGCCLLTKGGMKYVNLRELLLSST